MHNLFQALKKFTNKQEVPVISREAVLWGYRLFLDRDPEDEKIILEKMARLKNRKDLRQDFIQSDEFKMKNPSYLSTALSGNEPEMKIEEISSEAELQILFKHIQDSWQHLGKTEPYWSVLTSDKFLQANIQNTNTIADFYESGEHDVSRILETLERNQIDFTLLKSCLEYGCGVGRITQWLAKVFDIVYGYDISQEHLQIAKQHVDSKNIQNIFLHQIEKLNDVECLPKVDFIYSVIVLQHNPPPIIQFIIRQLIKALNPNGVALFQVPTYKLGYEFSLQEYLSGKAKRGEVEMHVLPQNQVFKAIRQEGGKLLEVIEDGCTGLRYKEMSNTFLVQKE
ncbi:MAG: class I SAM-dependent methyltransferase [Brasilonema angustatum HA4187-MV1]|jgi:2-polyprenyl-3-methyl-5-hydroxy-6-metoxy-1,4-benzoquinol methylase|nr:class I SAM-dependent methyltransferase [Brasilonema angustatum HA4187-MV1]